MKKAIIICFILLMAIPAAAEDFNCKFPPFGKNLDELHEQGMFLKHKEKNGITYYTYTGNCTLNINKYVSEVDQYFGFIDHKLYCNILSFKLPQDVSYVEFEEYCHNLIKDYIVGPIKTKEKGDWIIKRYKDKLEGLIIKLKYNKKTREEKVAWYYTPLKEKYEYFKDKQQ